jgi:hypothetical protein
MTGNCYYLSSIPHPRHQVPGLRGSGEREREREKQDGELSKLF